MKFKTTLMAGTVMGALALAAGSASAQTAGTAQAQLDALNKQIQELQSQLKSMSEKLDKDIKAVDKKVTDMPRVTVANGRPRFQSPAGAASNFDVALRTRFHLDYGYWFPDAGLTGNDLPDGFNVRRAFIGLNGTVFSDWAFDITADFSGRANGSGRLQNVYLAYTGVKGWAFEVGAFQPSFTLNDTIGSNDIPFIERTQVTNLAVGIVANEARAAVGFRHNGERYRVSAYLTGQQIGQTAGGTNDDQTAGIVRASFLAATGPNYDVHLGADYGYMWEAATPAVGGINVARNYSLSERPETRIGGLGGNGLGFNSGNIDTDDYAVYGVEFGATYNAFWTMAEWFEHEFDQRAAGAPDVSFDTWYVSAGYFLTGERRPYGVASGNFVNPAIKSPFTSKGGTGAWEIAARYSVANLTDTGVPAANRGLQGDQSIWTLGVNWYPNAAVRFMVNYSLIEIERLGGAIATEADALTARVQFQF